jgi:hypothetical protein
MEIISYKMKRMVKICLNLDVRLFITTINKNLKINQNW